jgi:hypothetical protein
MAGHQWARNGGGDARCGRCLGAERREEGRGEVRWRAVMAPLYIGAEGEAAASDKWGRKWLDLRGV